MPLTSSWTPKAFLQKWQESEESCEKQGWKAPTEAQYIVYKLSTWTDTQIFSAWNKTRKGIAETRKYNFDIRLIRNKGSSSYAPKMGITIH